MGRQSTPLRRSAPAGSENPQGFHSFVKPIPDSCRESAAGRQSTPLWRSAPAGSENPQGFHPFVNFIPILAGRSAVGRQSTPLWRLCFPCGRAMPP
ncbi:MAG: hypothetical protein LBK61_00925 [Spirochaetaceae bacterium]|nr:hypothetical protein [Spirochaetaceae bacterium]